MGNSIVDGLAPSSPFEPSVDEMRARNEAALEETRANMQMPELSIADGLFWSPPEPVITSPLDSNPDLFANLPMPTPKYAEPSVGNVPRTAAGVARDPVVDYASATVGDFWKDGVREASYSGIDRQVADAFDGMLASSAAAPLVVPGQEMSDALYLPGYFPVSRQDVGIASLTVNSALNLAATAVNAVTNAIGVLTEPLDRYQGEITSVETGLGPIGMAAMAPTLLLGRLSSVIRAERALNAELASLRGSSRAYENALFNLDPRQTQLASKEFFDAVAARRDVTVALPGTDDLKFLDMMGADASAGGVVTYQSW